jgi:hypothetical protein
MKASAIDLRVMGRCLPNRYHRPGWHRPLICFLPRGIRRRG